MQQRMDLSARRDLNNGFGDALSRAFEFAATPAIFGGVGYPIDQWLDTTPIFTIVLALWAVVGSTVLWCYRYDAKMQQIEAEQLTPVEAATRPTVSRAATRRSTWTTSLRWFFRRS